LPLQSTHLVLELPDAQLILSPRRFRRRQHQHGAYYQSCQKLPKHGPSSFRRRSVSATRCLTRPWSHNRPRWCRPGVASMPTVTSKDGTTIAYDRTGSGPALILVDGALCSRSFGPMPKLAPLFAPHFTVITYDRRGRGGSGDTEPYDPVREVEDLG